MTFIFPDKVIADFSNYKDISYIYKFIYIYIQLLVITLIYNQLIHYNIYNIWHKQNVSNSANSSQKGPHFVDAKVVLASFLWVSLGIKKGFSG